MKIFFILSIITILVGLGYWYYSISIKQEENITTEHPTSTLALPDYGVFEDKDFPFTFEYPGNWNIVELSTQGRTPNSVFDNNLKDVLIGKDVSTKPESRKIGEWFVISKGETPFPSNMRTPSTEIVLDGRKVNMYDVGSGVGVYIIQISVGSNVYKIQFNGEGTLSNQFEKLKSSFRFNGPILFP